MSSISERDAVYSSPIMMKFVSETRERLLQIELLIFQEGVTNNIIRPPQNVLDCVSFIF